VSEAKKKKGASVYSILGEAFREPEYSSHIKKIDTDIHPPEIVFSDMTFKEDMENEDKLAVQKIQLKELAESYAKEKKLKMKDGCILAGVVSYPPETTKEILVDVRRRLVIPFLRKKWGGNLRCIVGHNDEYFWDDETKTREPHYQDHFYVIPDAHGKIRITELHAGKVAKNKAIAGKAGSDGKKHSDLAYINAMRKEQDEFYEAVGKHVGWKRSTVNGLRYSREEVKIWKQNQREMERKINFTNNAVSAIMDEKNNLSGEKRIGVKVIEALNAENLTSDEKKEFYKIFFNKITDFVKDIIKTVRERKKQEIQQKVKNQTNEKAIKTNVRD